MCCFIQFRHFILDNGGEVTAIEVKSGRRGMGAGLLPTASLGFLAPLPFFQETLQEEGKEIGECIELTVPTDVLIAKLNAILHIWI